MEIKIKGYLKFKKTPIDIFGKHNFAPMDDIIHQPLFGKMNIDSNGNKTIALGKEDGDMDFVFVVHNSADTDKKSVIFNYTDANTGYNTMCFEMRMCDQCTPNGNVFSSNECVHIHLTESVETMLLLDSISEKGGNLKIKANLTADVSFKCKMSLDLAVVPRYDA